MTRTLSKRLETLERFSAGINASRSFTSAAFEQKLAGMIQGIECWHADPVNQQRLAEQPADFISRAVRELRDELAERAHGHFGVAA